MLKRYVPFRHFKKSMILLNLSSLTFSLIFPPLSRSPCFFHCMSLHCLFFLSVLSPSLFSICLYCLCVFPLSLFSPFLSLSFFPFSAPLFLLFSVSLPSLFSLYSLSLFLSFSVSVFYFSFPLSSCPPPLSLSLSLCFSPSPSPSLLFSVLSHSFCFLSFLSVIYLSPLSPFHLFSCA